MADTTDTIYLVSLGALCLVAISGGFAFFFPQIPFKLMKLEVEVVFRGTFIERWFLSLTYDRFVRLFRLFIIGYIGLFCLIFLVVSALRK